MKHPDLQGFDAEEQEEWLDALEGVLKREGVAAASALLQSLAGLQVALMHTRLLTLKLIG